MEELRELKELSELITQVRLDIRELTTEVRSLKDLGKKVEEIDDKAIKATESTRAAHKRLDEIAENQKWLWRTIIGAVIAGAIGLLWKGMGN